MNDEWGDRHGETEKLQRRKRVETNTVTFMGRWRSFLIRRSAYGGMILELFYNAFPTT
jgi:hypothetical protein